MHYFDIYNYLSSWKIFATLPRQSFTKKTKKISLTIK